MKLLAKVNHVKDHILSQMPAVLGEFLSFQVLNKSSGSKICQEIIFLNLLKLLGPCGPSIRLFYYEALFFI